VLGETPVPGGGKKQTFKGWLIEKPPGSGKFFIVWPPDPSGLDFGQPGDPAEVEIRPDGVYRRGKRIGGVGSQRPVAK
jgi:hypothetical protein